MIWLSPRQSRGNIAAATTLVPSALAAISPPRGERHGVAALKQSTHHVSYLTLAEIVVPHPWASSDLGENHGKQDARRSLRRHDDARALPHVPQGRIGRPGVSAGGRRCRGNEGEAGRSGARRRSAERRLAPTLRISAAAP